jgi:hypothetical protein
MVLHSQKTERGHGRTIPMPDDYLNFWLLSVGQLKPGFSWTDQLDPQYLALDTDKKFRQTKAFLEETCKDLLVIHKYDHAYKVEFMHRTIFDFLCDNPTSLPIEKHAPGHFSDKDFAVNLLKLRCICRLREDGMSCTSSNELLHDIFLFFDTTTLETHQPWLLACESAVLETFRAGCDCLGLQHMGTTSLFARHCARSGLYRYLLDAAENMPHEAVRLGQIYKYDYLVLALLEPEKADTRQATAMLLLNQALRCGCDPNVSLRANQTGHTRRQTKWEHWLHERYLYSQKHSRAARSKDRAHHSIDATQKIACRRTRENAVIIDLLLRHGAGTNCTPCTTDHRIERTCSPVALHDILQFIVPAECLSPLATLLVACSSEDRRHTLRRNQRKRAVRSYIISEQKFATRVIDRCPQTPEENETKRWTKSRWVEWRDHQRSFLRSLMVPEYAEVKCKTWKSDEEYTALLTWCVDCESRSHACLSCRRPHYLTKGSPCTNFSKFRITQPEGHTTVAVVFDVWVQDESDWDFNYERPADLSSAYQSLGCGPGELDLTPEAVLSVLKEWYAKNPIEPDSLPKDDIRPMALPEELDLAGLSMDDRLTDETSTPH